MSFLSFFWGGEGGMKIVLVLAGLFSFLGAPVLGRPLFLFSHHYGNRWNIGVPLEIENVSLANLGHFSTEWLMKGIYNVIFGNVIFPPKKTWENCFYFG